MSERPSNMDVFDWFFPHWGPFGLMELARETDSAPILKWTVDVLRHRPLSDDPAEFESFCQAAVRIIEGGDILPALLRLRRLYAEKGLSQQRRRANDLIWGVRRFRVNYSPSSRWLRWLTGQGFLRRRVRHDPRTCAAEALGLIDGIRDSLLSLKGEL